MKILQACLCRARECRARVLVVPEACVWRLRHKPLTRQTQASVVPNACVCQGKVRPSGSGAEGEAGRWLNIFLFFVWKLPEFPLTLFIVEL
ncbi:hypothetical protein C3V43_10725 [Bacteroides heparinolyticus]|nr:hypothetical protein C3V43_10725 [Bacteroides heparinolyticus]